MEKFKVYKHETVTSVAEIEAPSEEQALKFARVSEGMPGAPEYSEMSRRNPRLSASPEVTRETKKGGSKTE